MANRVTIAVLGPGGLRCTVEAAPDWTIFQVQQAVSEQLGHPVLWQSLMKGMEKLRHEVTVGTLLADAEPAAALELTLVVLEPAVASLKALWPAADDVVKAAVAAALLEILRNPSSEDCKDEAAFTFPDLPGLARVPGVIQMMVRLLQNASDHAGAYAGAGALFQLAQDAQDRVTIGANPDVIPSLVACLGTGSFKSIGAAVTALSHLADNRDNMVAIARIPEVIPSLVALLENGSDTYNYRALVAKLLGQLAHSDDVRVTIGRTPGAIRKLVALLRNAKEADQCFGATALSILAESDANRVAIAQDPDAIPLLVMLLQSGGNNICKANAADAVVKLAQNKDNKVTIARTPNAISSLAALPVHPELAGAALALLASNAENRVAIARDPDAIPFLAALMRFGNDEGKRHAVNALGHLAHDSDLQVAVASTPRVLETMGTLLFRQSPIGEEAAIALGLLASHADNRVPMARTPGLLSFLLLLLDTETASDTSKCAVMRTLALLWENDEVRVGLSQVPNIIRQLLACLENGNGPRKAAAARALHILAKDDRNKVAIASAPKAILLLLALLQNGCEKGKEAAAQALGRLAQNPENKATISQNADAIEALDSLLRHGSAAEQEAAAEALRVLGHSKRPRL